MKSGTFPLLALLPWSLHDIGKLLQIAVHAQRTADGHHLIPPLEIWTRIRVLPIATPVDARIALTKLRQLIAALLLWSVATGLPAWGAYFSDGYRWSKTYTDGTGLTQGDPTTLTWSIVGDGLSVESQNSNLVSYLDGLYGTAAGTDLTQRPWFATLADQFDNLAAKTGLTFQYLPDDGATWTDDLATSGHGDIRLAGYDLGTVGELGRAELPVWGGDILLDTANTSFANPNTLGTVLQHELGHSLGLLHVSVQGHSVLMNTGSLPPAGPQFDDLYALTRLYGDAYESPAGNDTLAQATALGTLTPSSPLAIGTDAADQTILREEYSFATIDSDEDVDYYRFEIDGPGMVSVSLSPRGPTYTYTPENLSARTVNASALSDLQMRMIDATTGRPLATVNQGAIGASESLSQFMLPAAGSYAIEVTGSEDDNQFYELNASLTEADNSHATTLFADRFEASSPLLNDSLEQESRQGTGRLTSTFEYTPFATSGGVPTVQVSDGALKLTAAAGTTEPTTASATLLRNFGADVVGEKWLLSFEVSLDASLTSDQAVFQFLLDDQWPLAEAMSDDSEITLRVAADGDYRLVEHGGNASGETTSTGSQVADTYLVQLLVDDTLATPKVTVALNGKRLTTNNPVPMSAFERYFGFEVQALDGLATGATIEASIDYLSLAIVTDAIDGDYNLDGMVDMADYTLWRNQLGRKVLWGTMADGSGNGVVDAADYQVWKVNFGAQSANLAQSQATTVPEPTAATLLAMLVAVLLFTRVALLTKLL